MDVGTYYVFFLIWCFIYYQLSHTYQKLLKSTLAIFFFLAGFPFYYWEMVAKIIHYVAFVPPFVLTIITLYTSMVCV